MLDYCYNQGLTLNEDCCIKSAKEDHSHILKYLKNNGCLGGINTLFSLVLSKSFDTIIHIMDNKLLGPIDSRNMNLSLMSGEIDVETLGQFMGIILPRLLPGLMEDI